MDDKETISVREQDLPYLKKLLGPHIYAGQVLAKKDSEKKLIESFDYSKIKEAYIKAHDIRKFEIELYWKRANHFWLFMTALAGLSGISISSSELLLKVCAPALIIVGLVFGLGFYLANKGSKYWQENWEKHVDMLEYYFSGDLYKLYFDSKRRKTSVTGINQHLSFVVCCLWLLAFLFSLFYVSNQMTNNICIFFFNFGYILTFCFVVCNSWFELTEYKQPDKSTPTVHKRGE